MLCMPPGEDKKDLGACKDGGQGDASLCIIQADAKVLELAEGIVV